MNNCSNFESSEPIGSVGSDIGKLYRIYQLELNQVALSYSLHFNFLKDFPWVSGITQ